MSKYSNFCTTRLAATMFAIVILLIFSTSTAADTIRFDLPPSGEPESHWIIYAQDGSAQLKRAEGHTTSTGYEVKSEQPSDQSSSPMLSAAIILTIGGRVVSTPLTPAEGSASQAAQRLTEKQHTEKAAIKIDRIKEKLDASANDASADPTIKKLVLELLKLDSEIDQLIKPLLNSR